jgi:hypothetical protein
VRSGWSTALAVAGVAVLVASLWWLQEPPRSEPAYADRAADTAATLRSQVETARIWAETVADGRTLLTSAAIGLEEADADAATALSDFEELDPPSGATGLRAAVGAAGGEAVDLLATVRIAAQHGDWSAVTARRDSLARMGDRMHALERRARR